MHLSSLFRHLPSAHAAWQLMIVFALLAITGCEQQPVITRTKVPKPPQTAAEDRMLAAIVPAKGRGWFVKLSGNKRAVEKEQDKFVELLSTLTVDGEKLNWKVPEGWSEKTTGNQMRAATLVAGDSKLEIAISFLPAEDATANDYLIANINRWRGQIGLANIGAADLPKEPKDSGELRLLKLKDGTPVTWVNLEGSMSGGSPMAPFAGGAPFANAPGGGMRKPAAGPSEDSTPEPAGDEFTYKKPDNWKVGKTGEFRKAAFEVADGKESIEITVSSLAKGGSDLLANINRWRGQLSLSSYDKEGLEKAMTPISIGMNEGHFIEMNNDREAILGAIVIVGDQGWFFKLKGDRELAMREKDNFQSFVRSMQFK